jgi:hypothetical protein
MGNNLSLLSLAGATSTPHPGTSYLPDLPNSPHYHNTFLQSERFQFNRKTVFATMPPARRKGGAPAVPKVAARVAPKVTPKVAVKPALESAPRAVPDAAPKALPRFRHGLVLVSSRVYDNIKRAIFQSTTTTATDLWYAETLMPNADNDDSSTIWDDSQPGPDPWNWTSPPRNIEVSLARPRYTANSMTSARYRRKKSAWYFKEMDLLRYHTELFGKPAWIKDIVEREIKNCEVLRKNPHPNICHYQGGNYDNTGAVTGLYFDQYDMSLSDVVKQSRNFDAKKCLSDIRAGIQHLHALGLVHCDIKPHNIFVDIKGQRFVVGDFDSIHEEGSLLEFKTGTTG